MDRKYFKSPEWDWFNKYFICNHPKCKTIEDYCMTLINKGCLNGGYFLKDFVSIQLYLCPIKWYLGQSYEFGFIECLL